MSLGNLEPLFTTEQLQHRIQELSQEILASYGGEPFICVGILKGSFIFLADLLRTLPVEVKVDFLGLSSYSGTESTGVVRLTHDLKTDISGMHVLVVEDIVDSGLTLSYLLRMLGARQPKSLKVVALLDKVARRTVDVDIDFVGFPIEDHFVVGYGLDLDEGYRGLPYIGMFPPSAE
ncbi:MAG: hypoxanthine phosphoribosyltransferase [Deltaproteobacteria bacterium]|nr:hypoxanthine phosphoribosyltransferase [Deltaproteobacteria bacterium]